MSGGAGSGSSAEPAISDRLARGREFRFALALGASADAIAAKSGFNRSTVYKLVDLAKAADGVVEPSPVPAAIASAPAAEPRKLSARALLYRAWLTLHLDVRLRSADPVAQRLWLEAVMAIRDQGDGASLLFAEVGFEDAADFAVCCGGTAEALAHLIRRRVLVDLDGAGVGLPVQLGLLPREKVGGRLVPGGGSGRGPDRRQSEMLTLVMGGRSGGGSESTNRGGFVDSESTNRGGFVDSESTNRGGFVDSESTPSPISVDSSLFPRATTATATRDSDDLSTSSSTVTRERESPNSGPAVDSESPNSGPAVDSGSPDPVAASVGQALLQILGTERALTPDEVGLVQACLAAGDTPDGLRDVAVAVARRPSCKRGNNLSYLRPAIVEARASRKALLSGVSAVAFGAVQGPAVAVRAAPVVSAEDQVLSDRVRAVKHPYPPSLADFRGGGARSACAFRWLDVAEFWVREGRPSSLKPPDFTLAAVAPGTFESDLVDVELAMTEPSGGSAAG